MKRLIHFFFILLISLSTFADCEPVDLEEKGGTLHGIPRHKQVLGTCYAHTVATMYDAYRKKTKQPHHKKFSSPADIAYQISKTELNIDGGSIGHKAFDTLNVSPPCPDKRKLLGGLFKIDPIERKYARIQNELEKLHEEKGSLLFEKYSGYSNLTHSEIDRILVEKYSKIIKKQFRCSSKNEGFNKIVSVLENIDVNSAVENAMQKICKPEDRLKLRSPMKIYNTSTGMRERINFNKADFIQEGLVRQMDEEFNKGLFKAYPVAIAYCSIGLTSNPNETVYNTNGLDDMERLCGHHASVVSARRKNEKTGLCEYKIRNSWGDCKAVDKSYECNPKNGDTWIPEKILNRFIYEFTKIEEST